MFPTKGSDRSMMYTPTPAARRPRPPGSIARPRLPSRPPNEDDHPSASSSVGSSDPNTPFSDYLHHRHRQDYARSSLARISASPGEVGDVSIGLDVVDSSSSLEHIKPRLSERIGLGLPSALSLPKNMDTGDMQPSPPPPYGQELAEQSTVPSGRTPPRVDSGVLSRHSSGSQPDTGQREERMRLRRATDAARAMGLELNFASTSDGDGEGEGEESDEISHEEIKRRYKDMRTQLKRRNDELVMAARVADQALRTHEQVIAVLPSSVKARIPHLINLLPHKPSTASRPRAPLASPPEAAHASLFPNRPSHSRDVSDIPESPSDLPSPNVDSHPFAHRRLHSQPSSSRNANMSPNYARLTAQQAEADERIASLEQALYEARDGEEKQRKAVARMRRDLEKLQREYERVEERVVAAESGEHGRNASRDPAVVWRRRESTIDKDLRSSYLKAKAAEERASNELSPEQSMGWGATSFPEYPAHAAQGELGEVLDRLSRMTVDTVRERSVVGGGDAEDTSPKSHAGGSRLKMEQVDQAASPSSSPTRPPRGQGQAKSVSKRSGSAQRRAAMSADTKKIRKKVSKSSFARPTPDRSSSNRTAIPLTPRVTVNAPITHEATAERSPSAGGASVGRSKSHSSSTRRKSPWPSPRVSISQSPNPNPRTTLDFSQPSSRAVSLSPGFASLSSRMASMRNYVASTLGVASAGPAGGRTLGSELGSEFGDDWNHTLHSLDDLAAPNSRGRSVHRYQEWESDEDEVGDEGDDEDGEEEGGEEEEEEPDVDGEDCESQYANTPAPLPPTVSAALSSLAIALAPTSMFLNSTDSSIPILPKGSLREPGLDYSAYELLSEAVRLRKIRWADGAPSSSSSSSISPPPPLSSLGVPPDILVGGGGVGVGGWTKWNKAEDPWEGGDYPDELSLSDSGGRGGRGAKSKPRSSSRSRPTLPTRTVSRPISHRTVSSSTDTSVALAHRRVTSTAFHNNQTRKVSPLRHTTDQLGMEMERMEDVTISVQKHDGTSEEPLTIPGRVVSDLICLLGMLVDYLEWWVIVCWRVSVEYKYGQRAGLGLGRKVKRRRYYL